MGALFLPSSDVYVRSLLYLFYTLINLYYTKVLSNQASFLAPIELFSSRGQESWRLSWFSNNLSDLIKKYSCIGVQYTRIYQLNKILIFKVLKVILKNTVFSTWSKVAHYQDQTKEALRRQVKSKNLAG